MALSALFVAIWNSYVTRRHFRLSVRPHLNICIKTDSLAPQLVVEVNNNGLGPAIIYASRVYIDEVLQPLRCHNHWSDIVHKLRFVGCEFQSYILSEEEALGSNHTMMLLTVCDKSKKLYDANAIESVTSRLRIEIDYRSRYGEKFKAQVGK